MNLQVKKDSVSIDALSDLSEKSSSLEQKSPVKEEEEDEE